MTFSDRLLMPELKYCFLTKAQGILERIFNKNSTAPVQRCNDSNCVCSKVIFKYYSITFNQIWNAHAEYREQLWAEAQFSTEIIFVVQVVFPHLKIFIWRNYVPIVCFYLQTPATKSVSHWNSQNCNQLWIFNLNIHMCCTSFSTILSNFKHFGLIWMEMQCPSLI